MAYEDEIEQKITGRTFEECKEKLFNAYGKDFRITNKVVDLSIPEFVIEVVRPLEEEFYDHYTDEQIICGVYSFFCAVFPINPA